MNEEFRVTYCLFKVLGRICLYVESCSQEKVVDRDVKEVLA